MIILINFKVAVNQKNVFGFVNILTLHIVALNQDFDTMVKSWHLVYLMEIISHTLLLM